MKVSWVVKEGYWIQYFHKIAPILQMRSIRCRSGWYCVRSPADWSFWVKSKLNYGNWTVRIWEMNQRQKWSEGMMIVRRCECWSEGVE